MNDKIRTFFEKYYDAAIELKEKFKITENKKWTPLTVLAELQVQVGHLSYLLSDYKDYGEAERKIDNIGDEISDVLLQIIAYCWKSNINIKDYDYEYKLVKLINPKEAILISNTLIGQITETTMEMMGFRHYKIRYGFSRQSEFIKYKLVRLIEIMFSLGEKLKVDLNKEFGDMLKDATGFLDRFDDSKKAKFFPIVDVHATWMVLNPIQGCPKKCRYCFLRERNLNQVKPKILVSPEEATNMLLKSKFYSPTMPLCLESQSDAFSTKENIEYVLQLLDNLMRKKIKNPIIFISKCNIPEYFIKQIDEYEKNGNKFVFFLSYSGLDHTVEVGVDKKIIEKNFQTLSKYNKTIVHYWRPFIKENSSKEKIEEVYNYVKKYCVASVAIGLKTTDDIIDNIGWDALTKNRKKALKADNVWNKFAYDYVWKELKNRDDNYPIYQTTSCALGYALGQADRKFFFNTDICKNCNKCMEEQRNRCKLKQEKYKNPTKKDVMKLLKKINHIISLEQIDIKDHLVILNDVELNFNEISFLTDSLETQVLTKKKEDDYYWNTSINNASILKL